MFYEARGQTWALILLLRAMEQDFGDVLDNKERPGQPAADHS